MRELKDSQHELFLFKRELIRKKMLLRSRLLQFQSWYLLRYLATYRLSLACLPTRKDTDAIEKRTINLTYCYLSLLSKAFMQIIR